MIKSLRLKNFKAFQDTGEIPIRPITLIFGPNSAGKSSILQAMLMMKQTLEDAKSPETALLPTGSFVDLGRYHDIAYRHDSERTISIQCRLPRGGFEGMDADATGMDQYYLDNPCASFQRVQSSADFGSYALATEYGLDGERVRVKAVTLFVGDEEMPLLQYSRQMEVNSTHSLPPQPSVSEILSSVFADRSASDESDSQTLVDLNLQHGYWRTYYRAVDNEDPTDLVAVLLSAVSFPDYAFEYFGQDPKQLLHKLVPEARDDVADRLWRFAFHGLSVDEQRYLFDDLTPEQRDAALSILELPDNERYVKAASSKTNDDESVRLMSALFGVTAIARPQDKVRYQAEKARLASMDGFEIALEAYPKMFLGQRISLRRGLPCALNGRSLAEIMQWEVTESYSPSILTLSTEAQMHSAHASMSYIGPLRPHPQRYYRLHGDRARGIGTNGEWLPASLAQSPKLVEEVNALLNRFQLGFKVEINRLNLANGEESDMFEVRLLDKERGLHPTLSNVGFGVSQVLPILAESIASKNQTILIEQPELHLHPALQADLADVFIDSALGASKNTFVIETHSEHLILRLLRRVRETTEGTLPEGTQPVRPEDLSILYVKPTSEGSVVYPLQVAEDGDFLDSWPDGFFPERAKELFGE